MQRNNRHSAETLLGPTLLLHGTTPLMWAVWITCSYGLLMCSFAVQCEKCWRVRERVENVYIKQYYYVSIVYMHVYSHTYTSHRFTLLSSRFSCHLLIILSQADTKKPTKHIFQIIRQNFNTLPPLYVNEVNMIQETGKEVSWLEHFSSGYYSPRLNCTGSSRDKIQQKQINAGMCSQ